MLNWCQIIRLDFLSAMSQQEESHSTPALMQVLDRLDAETAEANSSLNSIPENSLLESYTRLSISLEDNGLFNGVSVSGNTLVSFSSKELKTY